MSKSPSLRRIQADIRELKLDPSDRYAAARTLYFTFEFSLHSLDVVTNPKTVSFRVCSMCPNTFTSFETFTALEHDMFEW
jgi:hypothetical protein